MILHDEPNLMTVALNKLRKNNRPVILFGASLCGSEYMRLLEKNGIDVYCFVDDDEEKQKKFFCGKQVVSVKALKSLLNSQEKVYDVVISSYGPDKLYRRLMEVMPEYSERIHVVDFYLYENGLDYFRYFTEHKDEVQKAQTLLSDDKSRSVFKNLLQYKISRNRYLIEEIQDDTSLQYFDETIMCFSDEEIFLDLGAYNGDTIAAFVKATNNCYKKIIAIEPDKENYNKLLLNVKKLPNVECHLCGVSEKDGMVHFRSDALWTSAVDENGSESITVCSVDSLTDGNRITFLKADIEGLETSMILGAKETITRYKPKLAIAVYHRKEDIFRLINMINEYNRDYKFYLRHYTEMPIDTVLYAV